MADSYRLCAAVRWPCTSSADKAIHCRRISSAESGLICSVGACSSSLWSLAHSGCAAQAVQLAVFATGVFALRLSGAAPTVCVSSAAQFYIACFLLGPLAAALSVNAQKGTQPAREGWHRARHAENPRTSQHVASPAHAPCRAKRQSARPAAASAPPPPRQRRPCPCRTRPARKPSCSAAAPAALPPPPAPRAACRGGGRRTARGWVTAVHEPHASLPQLNNSSARPLTLPRPRRCRRPCAWRPGGGPPAPSSAWRGPRRPAGCGGRRGGCSRLGGSAGHRQRSAACIPRRRAPGASIVALVGGSEPQHSMIKMQRKKCSMNRKNNHPPCPASHQTPG